MTGAEASAVKVLRADFCPIMKLILLRPDLKPLERLQNQSFLVDLLGCASIDKETRVSWKPGRLQTFASSCSDPSGMKEDRPGLILLLWSRVISRTAH